MIPNAPRHMQKKMPAAAYISGYPSPTIEIVIIRTSLYLLPPSFETAQRVVAKAFFHGQK